MPHTCIRLDYALASHGIISSIEHVCYDHTFAARCTACSRRAVQYCNTFAASDHCPMHIDISKSMFPAETSVPPGAIKAPKQKGIAAFFKRAK